MKAKDIKLIITHKSSGEVYHANLDNIEIIYSYGDYHPGIQTDEGEFICNFDFKFYDFEVVM
jgi:hypothetical protein